MTVLFKFKVDDQLVAECSSIITNSLQNDRSNRNTENVKNTSGGELKKLHLEFVGENAVGDTNLGKTR